MPKRHPFNPPFKAYIKDSSSPNLHIGFVLVIYDLVKEEGEKGGPKF